MHVAEIAKRLAPARHRHDPARGGLRGRRGAPSSVDGLEVRRLGPIPVYYPRAVATTAWETRRGRWDVVVEHLNKVPFCARAYAAGPVLAVNHHLFGDSAFLQVGWPIAATVVAIEKLIPRIYRNVPCLAVSESSRDDLVRRGLSREQIGLLHNGITFPTRQPIEVSKRPCRVAYLGRLESYKRIDRLLRACAGLVDRFPQLEIALIGRGAERRRLEALAAELGIAERTRFSGFVSDAERDALLAEARVAVCASVKEGWGLTVIECNALGVPVVATDAPGLRDAVRHGETGLPGGGRGGRGVQRAPAGCRSAACWRMSSRSHAWPPKHTVGRRRFDWERLRRCDGRGPARDGGVGLTGGPGRGSVSGTRVADARDGGNAMIFERTRLAAHASRWAGLACLGLSLACGGPQDEDSSGAGSAGPQAGDRERSQRHDGPAAARRLARAGAALGPRKPEPLHRQTTSPPTGCSAGSSTSLLTIDPETFAQQAAGGPRAAGDLGRPAHLHLPAARRTSRSRTAGRSRRRMWSSA